jgi:hypothetical protein
MSMIIITIKLPSCDIWQRELFKLIIENGRRIETITMAWASTTSTTSTLVSGSLRGPGNVKCGHSRDFIEEFSFDSTSIDYITDVRYRKGSFCDISGHHTQSRSFGRRSKHFLLAIGG